MDYGHGNEHCNLCFLGAQLGVLWHVACALACWLGNNSLSVDGWVYCVQRGCEKYLQIHTFTRVYAYLAYIVLTYLCTLATKTTYRETCFERCCGIHGLYRYIEEIVIVRLLVYPY